MSQQPIADGLASWCSPNTISPTSWITGFSDNSEIFFCAISGPRDDLTKRMEKCCQGSVKSSGDGCYHWCTPSDAKKTDDWADCISDHVYTDELRFGQSCNSIGDLERKNKVSNGLELRPGADPNHPNSGVALSASWKLGVFLGVVGLLQVV
ncbi:hypothetical protein Q7P37_007655 [Cladosporium fusiforme]